MSATSQPAAALAPEQALGTFVGHVCRYFETVGGSRPQMLEPSIELRPSARLAKTGYMAISGVAEGWIALSMPDPMLHRLLERLGETLRDRAALLDLTAEMAGSITSNARAEYGERLLVTPPFAIDATEPEPPLRQPPVSLKLPFLWENHEAFLRIALLPQPPSP